MEKPMLNHKILKILVFILAFWVFSPNTFAQSNNLAAFLEEEICFNDVYVYNNGVRQPEVESNLEKILERLNLLYNTKFDRFQTTCSVYGSYSVNFFQDSSGYFGYVTEINLVTTVSAPDSFFDLESIIVWRTWDYGIRSDFTYAFLERDLTRQFQAFLIEWRKSR
jgi:hypothetical protein